MRRKIESEGYLANREKYPVGVSPKNDLSNLTRARNEPLSSAKAASGRSKTRTLSVFLTPVGNRRKRDLSQGRRHADLFPFQIISPAIRFSSPRNLAAKAVLGWR